MDNKGVMKSGNIKMWQYFLSRWKALLRYQYLTDRAAASMTSSTLYLKLA